MDFQELNSGSQAAVLHCVRHAHGINDVAFHRSLDRLFASEVDKCSARVLALTNKLVALASGSLQGGKGKEKQVFGEEDLTDSFHALVVDPLDILLEKADACLDEYLGHVKSPAIPTNPPLVSTLALHTRPLSSRSDRLDPAIMHAAHLPKPQLLFKTLADNSNRRVSHPKQVEKFYPINVTSVSDSIPDDTALSGSLQRPFWSEVRNISYPERLFVISPPLPPRTFEDTPFTWVSTQDDLIILVEKLANAGEVAIDLEHQSYRSFYGFVCLMQLSTREEDFIIDTLALRGELHVLNKIFTNPAIIKVFHGAESDIVWLQQDFDLYVVNLFDTFHASKALDFPRHSLAALLSLYCDFVADKKYQLADWRIRPLPAEMLYYARSDTHFLLFIYDNMRNALLERAGARSDLIRDVLIKSEDTSLRTYEKEIYDYEYGAGPNGWETLTRKWSKNLTGIQMSIYRAIHAWRDEVAREEDESLRYVLPNKDVFRLVERAPKDAQNVLASFSIVPPLVRSRAPQLAGVICGAITAAIQGASQTKKDNSTAKQDVEHLLDTSSKPLPVADLWVDNPGPLTKASESNLFRSTLKPKATSLSSLLGSIPVTVTNAHYVDVVSQIHRSLLPLPAPFTAVDAFGPSELGSSTADIPPELLFVPMEDRQCQDQILEQAIVVVGQAKKKRKREAADKPKSTDLAEIFDYAAAPNLLDPETNVENPTKKPKKEQVRRAAQNGVPPKAASGTKFGNRSQTFLPR